MAARKIYYGSPLHLWDWVNELHTRVDTWTDKSAGDGFLAPIRFYSSSDKHVHLSDKMLPLEVDTTAKTVNLKKEWRDVPKFKRNTACLQDILNKWPDSSKYAIFLVGIHSINEDDDERPVEPVFGRLVCVVGYRNSGKTPRGHKYSFRMMRHDDHDENHIGKKVFKPIVELFAQHGAELSVNALDALDLHSIAILYSNVDENNNIMESEYLCFGWTFLLVFLLAEALNFVEGHKHDYYASSGAITNHVVHCINKYEAVLMDRQYHRLFRIAVKIQDWVGSLKLASKMLPETNSLLKRQGARAALRSYQQNNKKRHRHDHDD